MKTRSRLGILGPLVFAVACSQSDAGITTNAKAKLVADDLVKARQSWGPTHSSAPSS